MKSTTKRPRVGPTEARRLRAIATDLGNLGQTSLANELRGIANLIAPESSVDKNRSLTYFYRLFWLVLQHGSGQKINEIVGDLYSVDPATVPVIASRNKRHGESQIKRLKGGDKAVSKKRVIEEMRATIPKVPGYAKHWRRVIRLLTAKQKR